MNFGLKLLFQFVEVCIWQSPKCLLKDETKKVGRAVQVWAFIGRASLSCRERASPKIMLMGPGQELGIVAVSTTRLFLETASEGSWERLNISNVWR